MRSRQLFGELKADQPGHLNDGLLVATNCYAAANGYRPVRAFEAQGVALPAECIGATSFRSSEDVTALFAATADAIYRRASSAWSAVGAGYSTGANDAWEFALFGDLVIATNGTDAPQKFDLTNGVSFSDLGGSPPTMEVLGVVKDFLVGGVIDGDATRIQWSAAANCEFWTPGQRLSDYRVFPFGGKITGLTSGEYGLVFQERRISRLAYTGDDRIFDDQEISANVGCAAPRSLVQFAGRAYFLSDQGFAVCDGQGVDFIGDERVDRTFLSGVTRSLYPRMAAAVDPINKLIIWTEPSSSNPTRWWVYSITQNRWTVIGQGADRVFSGFSADTTLEDMDVAFEDLESVSPSMDDFSWLGGTPALYVIDNNHTLGTMSGDNMAATFTLGDVQFVPGRRSRLRYVEPLTDATELTLTDTYRKRLADAPQLVSTSTLSREGRMKLRKAARYHRLSLQISAGADWTYAQGLDVVAEDGGE